jgi:outer membrane protein assembly factor BamA
LPPAATTATPHPTGPGSPGLPLGQRAQTLQGFDLRGGDLSINPRLDLRVPLPFLKPLQVGVFLDMGNVWLDPSQIRFDSNFMRFGFGPGLRYPTPIGAIAFDYGFNLNRRYWEDVGAFHFSIGLF